MRSCLLTKQGVDAPTPVEEDAYGSRRECIEYRYRVHFASASLRLKRAGGQVQRLVGRHVSRIAISKAHGATLGHVRYRLKSPHRGSPVRAGVRRRRKLCVQDSINEVLASKAIENSNGFNRALGNLEFVLVALEFPWLHTGWLARTKTRRCCSQRDERRITGARKSFGAWEH